MIKMILAISFMVSLCSALWLSASWGEDGGGEAIVILEPEHPHQAAF